MAMFSFTMVESWRNVNFLPKCTRLHQIESQISKSSRGDTPDPHPWGGGPETSPPLGASRLDSWPSATRWSPWQFHTPPETNGWIKPWPRVPVITALVTTVAYYYFVYNILDIVHPRFIGEHITFVNDATLEWNNEPSELWWMPCPFDCRTSTGALTYTYTPTFLPAAEAADKADGVDDVVAAVYWREDDIHRLWVMTLWWHRCIIDKYLLIFSLHLLFATSVLTFHVSNQTVGILQVH